MLRDARGIRFVHLFAGQDLPADPDHLVGERDDRDVPMAASFHLPKPLAEIRAVSLHMQVERVGALDKKLAQVRVPALAYPAHRRLAAGRVLSRDEPEPGGHPASARKHATVPDRGDDGGCDHRPDAWDRRGATTQLGLFGPLGEISRRLLDLDIDRKPSLPKPME